MPLTRRLSVQDRSIAWLDETTTGTITPAGTETVAVTPPAGYIYRLLTLRYHAGPPAGASSGTHSVQFRLEVASGKWANLGLLTQVFNGLLQYDYSGPKEYSSCAPLVGNFADGMRAILFDNTHPLNIYYTNSTDANQAADREIFLICEKIRVA